MSTASTTEIEAASLIGMMATYVKQTRRYGHTYVHSAVRKDVPGWRGVTAAIGGRHVRMTYTGWGRSLSKGGHKYKAHANWADTGKPVASKMLGQIVAI